MLVAYNGMGGHSAISYVGDLLCGVEMPSFGPAVIRIDAYPRLESAVVAPGLESMKLRYDKQMKKLPLAWFRRKTRRFDITYRSRLGDAAELLDGRPRPLNLEDAKLVRIAYRELVEALGIIAPRVRSSDEFDADSFLAFVGGRALVLDRVSDQDLVESIRVLREQEQIRIRGRKTR